MPSSFDHPLISAPLLAARLGDPHLRVVDATWFMPGDERDADRLFLEGHIAGAVRFDIDAIADMTSPLPHMAPPPEAFAAHMTRLEIDSEDFVVVYDRHGIFSAARAWWLMRLMGHGRVAVLDGGWGAWTAGDYPTESGEAQPRDAPTRFTPAFKPELVANLDDVRVHIASGRPVLDARPPLRFQGKAPEPRPGLRSGAMPGAANFPVSLFTTPDGHLKSEAETAEIFKDVDLSTSIICTCGSGVSAAVVALALAHIGYWNVAVYDGSWAEWGARADLPVVVTP